MGCGASAEAPTNGTRLEFIVESASGLPNTETIGMIDPYCTIMFQPKVLTWKTDEIENSQTPTWHAFFHCNVTPEEVEKGDLHICVWNKNTTSDDYLGDVWTSCKGMPHNQADTRELTLKNAPEGATNAKVTVTIKLVDFGERQSQKDSPASAHTFRPAKNGYQPPASFAAMYSNTNFGVPQQQSYPQQAPPPQQQQHQPQQHQQQQQQQGYPPQQQGYPTGRVGLRSAHGLNLQGHQSGHVGTCGNLGDWEKWTLENRGGHVVLRSHHNSYMCGHQGESADVVLAPHVQEWEMWTVAPHPGAPGKFMLRSHHNTYLSGHPDGKVTLTAVPQAWEAWEMFNV